MSETTIKVYRMKKTVPGDVLMVIHPLSNMELSRTIYLTDRNPVQVLPQDWALGIFMDNGNYNMYKQGYITFENNDELVKAAYEAGAYFDEMLDFTPAKENNEQLILTVLKAGNRANINKAIKDYGTDAVKQVAIMNVEGLSTGVVRMLEEIFKVQLVMDGGETNVN